MSEEKGVINSVLACYEGLSDAERRIADFILQRRGSVSSLTAGEIAQESGTSNTTVSRFVRTLGFGSFARLRLALAREEAAEADAPASPEGISLKDVEGSVRYILQNKIEELTDTASSLDYDALEHAARCIKTSNTVMIVGVGTSMALAEMAATKLSHVGVRTVAPATTDAAAILAQLLDSSDCILFISNSGMSQRLNAVMDNALDSAVPTIALTANPHTHLTERADIVLTVSVRDQLLARDFSFSHNSLNFVMECLIMLLFHSSEDAGEYLRMFHKAFSAEKSGTSGGFSRA